MTLKFQNGRFEVHDYKGKLPGFIVDPDDGVQFSIDVQLVQAYIHYADRDTEYEIYKQVAELKSAIEQSRSLEHSIVVPAPKGKIYDPCQLAAVAFAIPRKRVIFGDEMGIGKTVSVLGVINYCLAHKLSGPAPRGLIICQKHLVEHWLRHLGDWLIEEHGIAAADSQYFPRYAQFVVINYDILEKQEQWIKMAPWEFLIIDEFQHLSNPKANRTRQAYGNPNLGIDPIPCDRAILLSGTPINNRPVELFPTLHFLDSDRWRSLVDFGMKYCDGKKKRDGKTWDFKGASHLSELQAKLRSTVMIRRLKEDVLKDLPPKRRQVIELPPGASDLEWIKEMQDAFDSYEQQIDGAKKKAEQAKVNNDDESYKAAMEALRYTLNVQFKRISAFRYKTAIAKLPFVVSHLEDVLAEGKKVVVFGHHHEVLETIFKKFKDIAAINYGGSLQLESPQQAADRFQRDPTCQLFLCSIRKCEGLTLTEAHHEIFAELDWVPSKMKQAEDRCHRRGSKADHILIQVMVLAKSLDAKMAHKIVSKLIIMEQALDRDEKWEDPDPIEVQDELIAHQTYQI